MNLLLLNVLCALTTSYRPCVLNKKPVIRMVENNNVFTEVPKIFRESVEAVSKINHGWFISDIIAPVGFAAVPQYAFFAILDKAIVIFPNQSNTLFFILVVTCIFYYILMLQVEFLKRYLEFICMKYHRK